MNKIKPYVRICNVTLIDWHYIVLPYVNDVNIVGRTIRDVSNAFLKIVRLVHKNGYYGWRGQTKYNTGDCKGEAKTKIKEIAQKKIVSSDK